MAGESTRLGNYVLEKANLINQKGDNIQEISVDRKLVRGTEYYVESKKTNEYSIIYKVNFREVQSSKNRKFSSNLDMFNHLQLGKKYTIILDAERNIIGEPSNE
jgi:hypothetical protein